MCKVPVLPIINLLQHCLIHCDGVIEASSCVTFQVFTVAVASEDEGVLHKHAIALGRVGSHL